MQKWMSNWDELFFEEKLIFVSIISSVLHYSITIISCIMLGFWMIHKRKLKATILSSKGFKLVSIVLFSNALISLFYRNVGGFAYTLIMWGIGILALFFRNTITKEKVLVLLEGICYASIATFCYIVVGGIIQKLVFTLEQADFSRILFLNENFGAAVFSSIACISIYMYRNQRRKIFIASYIINILLIILAESRGAFIAVSIGTAVYFMLVRYHYFIKFKKWIYMIIGIIALYFTLVLLKIVPLFNLGVIERFITYRATMWNAGFLGFLHHPILGQGQLSYPNYCATYGSLCLSHSHNLYIELLLSYGVVGTIFIGYIGSIYLRSITPLIKYEKDLFAFIGTLIVMAVLHGIVDYQVFWIQPGYLLVCLLMLPSIYIKAINLKSPLKSS